MTYQELKIKYPNKEIKLISEDNMKTYINFGFKIIDSFYQGKYKIYFMIEV